jgi:hypothetical protein
VGYKVNSERAVQFRKWATGIIESFTIKGYAMDDERLKNDGSILGKKYFEEQLQRIREIRLSERKFYQKITDIYATSIDYDVTAAATQRFFATVQEQAPLGHPRTDGGGGRRLPRRCHERPAWASPHGKTRQREDPEIRCERGEELPQPTTSWPNCNAWSPPISMWPRTWRSGRFP